MQEKRVLACLHEQYNWFTHVRCYLSNNYVTTIANNVTEFEIFKFLCFISPQKQAQF